MLDMWLTHAINNAFRLYQDNLEAFQDTFPLVPAATIAEWHAAFAERKVDVRVALSPGAPEGLPAVSLLNLGEMRDTTTLAKQLSGEATGYLVKESVRAHVYARSDIQSRVLGRLIQVAVLRATRSILRSGYVDVQTDSLSAIDLELVFAENGGVYARDLEISAVRELVVPEALPDTPDPEVLVWAVQLEGVVPDPSRDPATGANAPSEDFVGSVIPSTE